MFAAKSLILLMVEKSESPVENGGEHSIIFDGFKNHPFGAGFLSFHPAYVTGKSTSSLVEGPKGELSVLKPPCLMAVTLRYTNIAMEKSP